MQVIWEKKNWRISLLDDYFSPLVAQPIKMQDLHQSTNWVILISITCTCTLHSTFFSKNPDFEFSISTSSHSQSTNSTVCLLLWLELDGYDFHVMRWINTSVWDITKMQRLIMKQHTHKKNVCQLPIILSRKTFSVTHCNFDFTSG